jgi:hypothetical protein
MVATDRLGDLLWPRNRDVIPRQNVRQLRPRMGSVHVTTGSSEALSGWLRQWGDIESGPGPKR